MYVCSESIPQSEKLWRRHDDIRGNVCCLRFYPFYKLAMISLSFCHKCEKFVYSELETT